MASPDPSPAPFVAQEVPQARAVVNHNQSKSITAAQQASCRGAQLIGTQPEIAHD
jgi:hypothetical protein